VTEKCPDSLYLGDLALLRPLPWAVGRIRCGLPKSWVTGMQRWSSRSTAGTFGTSGVRRMELPSMACTRVSKS